MVKWMQLLVTGIAMGSIYALIALGFVTIYRASRIVNMAQGSFVMFGGFFTFAFFKELGLPYWLAAIIGVLLTILLAVVMYQVVLRPVLKISLVTMILCTVAISLVFENLSLIKWGGYNSNLPAFTGEGSLGVGGVHVSYQALWVVGIMIVCLVLLYLLNNHTTLGKRMTATATNPMAASLSGINVSRMVLLSFAISAAIGAVGGLAITNYVGGMVFTNGGVYGMMGFIALAMGGWGSSAGAVLGGVGIGIFQSMFSGFIRYGYVNAIVFLLLLVMLYFRPQGVLGTNLPEGEF